jgi:hypothetical protein
VHCPFNHIFSKEEEYEYGVITLETDKLFGYQVLSPSAETGFIHSMDNICGRKCSATTSMFLSFDTYIYLVRESVCF